MGAVVAFPIERIRPASPASWLIDVIPNGRRWLVAAGAERGGAWMRVKRFETVDEAWAHAFKLRRERGWSIAGFEPPGAA